MASKELLLIGAGLAGLAFVALRKSDVEVVRGVRTFTKDGRAKILKGLEGKSLMAANFPGQFAMRVVDFSDEGVPAIKLVSEASSAVFASDSALDLKPGPSVGKTDAVLVLTDPSDGPELAGPTTKFARLR